MYTYIKGGGVEGLDHHRKVCGIGFERDHEDFTILPVQHQIDEDAVEWTVKAPTSPIPHLLNFETKEDE